MLVIELGFYYLEQKLVMMETLQTMMDENRSVWSEIEPPSSFWICLSIISPGFGEMKLFLLELSFLGSGQDQSQSEYTIWGNGLRAGAEEWDVSSQDAQPT